MLARRARKAAHIALFFVAFAMFYVGLGLGLQYDPNLGTLFWVGAALLVGLNIFWIDRVRRKSRSK